MSNKISLGLDISTSIIGYNVIEEDNITKKLSFLKYGYIDCNKLKDEEKDFYTILTIVDKILPELKQIIDSYKINSIIIEQPVKKFKQGMSSIDDITKLLLFNYTISYQLMLHCEQIKPIHIEVRKARNLVFGKGINSPRLSKIINIKDLCLKMLIDRHPELIPLKDDYLNRNDNISHYIYDISDSIIVNLCNFIPVTIHPKLPPQK